MPVSAYEDPWLPLDRAHGDLPHEMYGANGVIARWASCAMAALAELRRNQRELFSRTAKLNDRVSGVESGMVDTSGKLDALEAKINDTGGLLSAGVNGVVDKLTDELGTLFKDEVRRLDINIDSVMDYVRIVEAQVERLRAAQPDTEKTDLGSPGNVESGSPEPWFRCVRHPYTVSHTAQAQESYGGPTITQERRRQLIMHLALLRQVVEDETQNGREIEFLPGRILAHREHDDFRGHGGEWLTEIVEKDSPYLDRFRDLAVENRLLRKAVPVVTDGRYTADQAIDFILNDEKP